MDPINQSSVVLGGTRYVIKVTFAALRRLSDSGVSLYAAPDPNNILESNYYIASFFGACSHVERDGKLVWAGMSANDAEEIIDIRDTPMLQAVIEEAMAKTPAAETSPLQPPGS